MPRLPRDIVWQGKTVHTGIWKTPVEGRHHRPSHRTSSCTGNHLVKQQSGAVYIVHVPYRGMEPATNDLMGGQVTMVIAVMSGQLLQLNRAGALRILAVTTEASLVGVPGIPTAIESGML